MVDFFSLLEASEAPCIVPTVLKRFGYFYFLCYNLLYFFFENQIGSNPKTTLGKKRLDEMG